ncbi:MAG: DUF4349 domain-containing protein [Lachnospiraceae bacterium]|nr:DUF4349 domain-containing protein [Lachnospiraceae bacterium]
MKSKKLICTLSMISMILTGCGSSEAASAANYEEKSANYALAEESADEYYDEYDSYDYSEKEMPMEGNSYSGSTAGTGELSTEVTEEEVRSNDNGRMLIKRVYMNVESEDVDAMVKNVERKVDSLGGYIENTNIQNEKYSNSERKTANIVARIPVNKLDLFVTEVEGESNVLSKNSNAEDITLKYVDTQAKLSSYETEYERINELIKEAKDLDTIIALEARLSEIRYEIESYGAQLKTMKNQATYSTLTLDITQVIEYTPVVIEEKTRFEQMQDGFISNCKRVWYGILDFGVGFVVALPILIIWAVIIIIIIMIFKMLLKGYRKKHPVKNKRSKNINTDPDIYVKKPEEAVIPKNEDLSLSKEEIKENVIKETKDEV